MKNLKNSIKPLKPFSKNYLYNKPKETEPNNIYQNINHQTINSLI